jgi:hypothetical protein
VKTPRPSELAEFFKYDGWTEVRGTDHVHYEKQLATGELLESHRSFGNKPLGGNTFKLFLSLQVKISEAEFWEVLRTKRPAPRPSPGPEPKPATLPLWLGVGLEKLGVPRERITELTREEAKALLDGLRSSPKDETP